MFPIVSGVAMGQGPAAFAVSLTNDMAEPIIVFSEPDGGNDNPSPVGTIDFTAVASGGSGSYTFAWQIIIGDDGGGMLSVETQGTTDRVQYSNSQVVGGTNQGAGADFTVRCTVSDGVATDIVLNSDAIDVAALY